MSIEKIKELIKYEKIRQQDKIALIPSENYVSENVLNAVGSVLSNKYSEGYPGKRYYQGNEFIDEIEQIAIDKAKELFNVEHVNVQTYSGSPANLAVYFSILKPGDKIMGMSLPFGGHLTHGHPNVTISGKYYDTIQYKTDKDGWIDYEAIEELALEHKPKLIISGTSAYPREIDFKKFGEIADKIGAYHLADISHIAGLVVGKMHMSPVEHAHIITTTTHKTLRGPRGAMIMVTKKGLKKDADLSTKIDKAVFPGLQGGPHNNTTAGIAVTMTEADTDEFRSYVKNIIDNSKALAKRLSEHGFKLVSGGTDNHLILIDVTNKNIDGWSAAWALDYAGIIVNRNTIPFDERSPFYPSGIRIGTPAITTRGMGEKEMVEIADLINEVVDIASGYFDKELMDSDQKRVRVDAREEFKKKTSEDKQIQEIAKQAKKICDKFPIY